MGAVKELVVLMTQFNQLTLSNLLSQRLNAIYPVHVLYIPSMNFLQNNYYGESVVILNGKYILEEKKMYLQFFNTKNVRTKYTVEAYK